MAKYVTRMAKSGESESYAVKDTVAREAIAAEATARQQAVAAEETARQQAVAAEETTREAAVAAEAEARQQAVAAEATAREAAVAAEATAREAAVAAEATAREAAVAAEATARQQAVAGEAQEREKAVSELQNAVKDTVGSIEITGWHPNQKIWTQGNTVLPIDSPSYDSNYRWVAFPCSPGDVFLISGLGSSNTRLWTFTDSSYTVITQETPSIETKDLLLTAPAGSAFLVLNDQSGSASFYGIPVPYQLSELKEELSIAQSNAAVKTKTKTLKDLIAPTSMAIKTGGKMNNTGAWISADSSIVTRSLIYAKAGTTIQLPENNPDLVSFGVGVFDNNGNLLQLDRYLTNPYKSVLDGYIRVDLQFASGVEYTESDLFLLESCIVQDYSADAIVYVSNQNDLMNAFSSGQRIIYLMNDIDLDLGVESTPTTGDFVFYGNGHKLSCSSANPPSNYIQCWSGICEFHDLLVDGNGKASSPLKPTGDATVKFYNCEIYNCDGDGISPSQNAKVYLYNCKLHDCADEGFSSHDTTYCEVYDSEIYHNGYTPYTDEPSEFSSYGGLHLGGTHIGIARGNHCHHNYGGGISFCPLGQGDEDVNATAIVIGNVVNDNTRNGIRLEGLHNCRVLDNTVIQNGWGGIRVWVAQNPGVTLTTSGIIAGNTQALNVGNEVVIDDGADGGITVVN